MSDFDACRYGPIFAALITDRLPALGPGQPSAATGPKLAALSLERAFAGHTIVDRAAARCCLAGVWLWHDALGESHCISQEIDTREGSYWHAIMHRREPDYWNSKYWFRRVPEHPIFAPLCSASRELAARTPPDRAGEFLASQSQWDAARFVDLCQAIAQGQSCCERLAREIARAEWQLLFAHCFEAATRAAG